jgi:iron(III) transport system substrate-binding protein
MPQPLGRDRGRCSRREALAALAATAALGAARPADQVTVYAAHDREFSEPVLESYGKKTGVRVLPKFDVESTKTVGLTNLIVSEARRPRCDLFWNNEILNTLRLQNAGLLQPFEPENAADYPAQFRDPGKHWYGFAARARIILVNTSVVPEADRPRSILDLLDSKWRGRIGIAKPLFGTTASHAACLFASWGSEKAKRYYQDLKRNEAQILAGNRQVAEAVAAGQIAFGMTDTDDAMGQIENGKSVAIVYPDRKPGEIGTLFLPNTVCVIKGCPNPAPAAALAGFLLSPEVETLLANGPSAQIPLNAKTDAPARVETPRTVTAMKADFAGAASLWDEAAAFLTNLFAG